MLNPSTSASVGPSRWESDRPHPYASAEYAAAFRPLEAIRLPNTGTYVLKRPIWGTPLYDAMGCYPLCILNQNDALAADLDGLAKQGLVSLVLVTDCLTHPDEAFLHRHFDLCRPYKTHFIYDATLPNSDYSKHHRDRVRRARKSCETRVVELRDYLSDWISCYDTLTRRKSITGIQNFSRSYFEALADLPQITTIAAFTDGAFVSAHIWAHHGRSVYAHLAASTERGYKLRSAFAIYDDAIRMFRDGRTIDFGGGAGVEAEGNDGLADFKRGFANAQRSNFLCGKVLDHAAYRALCTERNIDADAAFFPAYRNPVSAPE